MTGIEHDPPTIPWGTDTGLAQPTRLTASLIVQRVQEAGRDMLSTPGLTEIEEGIFSTCGEQIELFHERLLRARDTRVPLVEVCVMPEAMVQDALREVFKIDKSTPVVRSILRSSGEQQYDNYWGNEIKFDDIGLSIPEVHSISLTGHHGSEITAVWMSGTLSGYDDSREGRAQPSRPSTGGSFQYEHDYFRPGETMRTVIGRAVEDFEIAVLRDGTIDVTAREVKPTEALGSGTTRELPA